jgi:hypothetical protein
VFMPMALLKRRIKVWELPLNWFIVFFGNLAGALCYTAFMGESLSLVMDMIPTASPLQQSLHAGHEDILGRSRRRQDKSGMGPACSSGHRMQLLGWVT